MPPKVATADEKWKNLAILGSVGVVLLLAVATLVTAVLVFRELHSQETVTSRVVYISDEGKTGMMQKSTGRISSPLQINPPAPAPPKKPKTAKNLAGMSRWRYGVSKKPKTAKNLTGMSRWRGGGSQRFKAKWRGSRPKPPEEGSGDESPILGGLGPSLGGKGPSLGGKGSSQGDKGPSLGGKGASQGDKGPSLGGKGASQGDKGPSLGGKGASQGDKGPSLGGKDPNQGDKGPSSGGKGSSDGDKGSSRGGKGPSHGGHSRREEVLPRHQCMDSAIKNNPLHRKKIYGGEYAAASDWPSYLLMSYTLETPEGEVCQEKRPMCGASLVHAQFALTAAHCIGIQSTLVYLYDSPGAFGLQCVQDRMAEREKFNLSFFLHSGPVKVVDNKIVNLDDERVETREVILNITHPDYTVYKYSMDHDIELVKLDKPFTLNKHTCIVDLVKDAEKSVVPGEMCALVGFGMEHEHVAQSSKQLKQGTVEIKDCNSVKYEKEGYLQGKYDEICVVGLNAAMCKGDNGGLLMCPSPDNKDKFVQVGIVSETLGGICKGFTITQRFTRISQYVEWILKSVLNANI